MAMAAKQKQKIATSMFMITTAFILSHSICTPTSSMEKKRALARDEGLLSHPYLFSLVLVLGLLFTDPFRLSPSSLYKLRMASHDVAPYKRVMAQWPGDDRSRLRLGKLEFAGEVFGPESIEFDRDGNGPYAGLADGRVVRWMGPEAGWETFATVSPSWTEEVCANGANSTTARQHEHEPRCGRPLGLRFGRGGGELYIADAYYGLMAVGPGGGLASPLATHVDGGPILFANDLDVHSNGSIFFTDTSARHSRRSHFLILVEGEATGRLLRYDPGTNATHVVMAGLAFANGVQLSEDERFLLFTETTNCRVMRYWLEGPKAGRAEVFADLPGFPDNVRVNGRGQFWVAIDCCRTPAQEVMARRPWLRSLYYRLPFGLGFLARRTGMEMYTVVALFDEDGAVVEVMEDRRGEVMRLVSEVREVKGRLWIGTVAHNHIATLPYP